MIKRRLSANYVYTGKVNEFFRNAIIELDENNRVIQVLPNADNRELAFTEFYNGILVPGFINVHSHLELSGLKNKMEKNTGLAGFFEQLNAKRAALITDASENALQMAIEEMWRNGIVAVGDIVNTADTLDVKQKFYPQLYFHNFVELIGFAASHADSVFNIGLELASKFAHFSNSSIVPHAVYSVSEALFELIFRHSSLSESILSIHHQESIHENLIIAQRAGLLAKVFNHRKYHLNDLPLSDTVSDFISHKISNQKLILVHNTFAGLCDLQGFNKQNTFLAICINSNLFIENDIPLIDQLYASGLPICLGTDSFASNDSLSILDEIKSIMYHFPEFDFSEVLSWATLNGAKALNIQNDYGSFEKGKKPGVNLIQNFDFKRKRVSNDSLVKRIA